MSGIKVAFWAPWHGRGNTANCMAVALQFINKVKTNAVITHTQYVRSSMEGAFLTGRENENLLNLSDVGIDSLERALRTGEISSGSFSAYCNKINEKLDFLAGTKKTHKTLFKNIENTLLDVLKFANESKEFTFIDLSSGLKDEITKRTIDSSDMVFITLEQNKTICDNFFNNEIKSKSFENKKLIVLIGKYDIESKFDIKEIQKRYRNFDGLIVGIPYLTDYLDAINSHKVDKFFETYHFLNDEPFFDSLNLVVDEIVAVANEINVARNKTKLELEEEVKEKQGFFKKFRN